MQDSIIDIQKYKILMLNYMYIRHNEIAYI